MPIFEYVCKKCNHHFETIVHGEKAAQCPECKSKSLEKQLSVFALSGSNAQESFMRNQPVGPCGSCGDPRGPGSCSMN